jgi:hypothetical protein
LFLTRRFSCLQPAPGGITITLLDRTNAGRSKGVNRLTQLVHMLMQRRVGFLTEEIMTGTHRFVGDAGPPGRHSMYFRITWGNRHLHRFLNPLDAEFLTNFIEGTVTVGGLVEDAPCRGSLELMYFSESKIRYTFSFEDAGGRGYHYIGEKINIRPWNLHRTHTTCYGTITDVESGKLISRSTLHFRLHTLPAFLMSFRLG